MPEDVVVVSFGELKNEFLKALTGTGFSGQKADLCAEVFAANTLDGIFTHGVERFARFVQYAREGLVDPSAVPERVLAAGAIERWDGRLGAGILNALFSTERAMQLSDEHGIGCVALANTNHWMRGGTYGRKAAEAGYVFIGWTNTVAIMPAWGAVDCRLGNNPLVLAVPFGKEPIVLDMAMSQFSYGRMERDRRRGATLPVPGGYDKGGTLSTDPAAILESQRPLPIGYWKGSGLALLLDLLAVVLSGGKSTVEISGLKAEHAVSQVFFCINTSTLNNHQEIELTVRRIIDDLHASVLSDPANTVLVPGERVLRTRETQLKSGIPISRKVWDEIVSLSQQ